jgi:hypothetical protein
MHIPFVIDNQQHKIAKAVRDLLGARLSDPTVADPLRAAYRVSFAQVLPLKEQLAHTDRLIDQIVYRLYGLTADEVAVMEEAHQNL